VIVVEQIEQAIKVGKIADPTGKKRFTRKKNDADVNNLERGSCQNSYQKPFSVSNVSFSTPFPKNQTTTPK
jgi:hypothetical protein